MLSAVKKCFCWVKILDIQASKEKVQKMPVFVPGSYNNGSNLPGLSTESSEKVFRIKILMKWFINTSVSTFYN